MVKLAWAHLCDYFLVDEHGKASIVGEFDRIGVDLFPAICPLFYVAARWDTDSGDAIHYRIRIRMPDGNDVLAKTNETIILAKDPLIERPFRYTADAFRDTKFPFAGEYGLEIYLRETAIHVRPLLLFENE